MTTRTCAVCSTDISDKRSAARYCSTTCKDKARAARQGRDGNTSRDRTDSQYATVNNNWERYFSRLLSNKPEAKLSIEFLMSLLKQQRYRCALSGTPLSCRLVSGVKFHTNASIDKINPLGGYVEQN